MSADRFKRLLQRMDQSGAASYSQLVGCSPQEIAALEAKYQLRLPDSYALYLRTMGHESGRLFKCDHMAVFYPHVLKMTGDQKEQWEESNAEDGSGPPPNFDLPQDALLIAGRLGEQFQFIRCNAATDSPLWYFNITDWEIKESHTSVYEWLESWCDEAEQAIADGYFDIFPDGTTP